MSHKKYALTEGEALIFLVEGLYSEKQLEAILEELRELNRKRVLHLVKMGKGTK